MSVKYDLYETPSPKEPGKKVKLHARVKTSKTVATTEIAKRIQKGCSLTEGSITAVLIALKKSIVDVLNDGDRVHIEGLGYFQMTLQCPQISSADEIRAESIRCKSIAFRPEKELKREFINTQFVRAEVKNHSKKRSEEYIRTQLTEYFRHHTYITRADFASLCGLTTTTACRRIKELVKDGLLKREGVYRSPIYTPTSGNHQE